MIVPILMPHPTRHSNVGGLSNYTGELQASDSDEVARAFRDDVARDYEMMSPGFGASLAGVFFVLGRCRSSVIDCVQSRPYPRGGTTAVSSSRSRSTIACSASPVAPLRKVSGSASSQAAYSACKATSTATVAPQ